MSLIPNECIDYYEVRKEYVAEEGGKVYRLINSSGFKVKKVSIDKCLVQKEGEKRCDYLMSINEKAIKRAIFIELKGGNLIRAIEQLFETILYLKYEFRDYRIDARIVGTKDVPELANTSKYLKLNRILKQSGGKIQRATNKILSETI